MSIQHAINFIAKVESDNDFRKSCYAYKTQSALLDYLKIEGFSFSAEEAEEAFSSLLFKCQTYEQHENIRHLEGWFKLFR